MKTKAYAITMGLILFFAGAPQVQSEEDHTFVANARGAQVCLGRWIPATGVGEFGVCEGQLIGLPQLTAISSRQSVERLDQLITVLASIDQKLDISNEQVGRLIEETIKSRTSADQQSNQLSEFLHETITQRFDALPKGVVVNKYIMAELTRLKEDILKDVEKRYPSAPSSK